MAAAYRITQNDINLAKLALQRNGSEQLSIEQSLFLLAEKSTTGLVLVAAAGSGKTTCLQEKLDREIVKRQVGDYRPHVISFSNAAAQTFQREYNRRHDTQQRSNNSPAEPSVASTLHSWCKRHLVPNEPRVSCIISSALSQLSSNSSSGATFDGQLMLVDEAQDCTSEQIVFLKALLERGMEVILVGDPRQSIFGFAGARPEEMESFSTRRMFLNTNYRSTRAIIEAANFLSMLSINGEEGDNNDAIRNIGSANLPKQTPRPDAPEGAKPTIRYCKSLQSYDLGTIEALLTTNKEVMTGAACIVTYQNSDVEMLHQNLSLRGVKTMSITANDDGEVAKIDNALKNNKELVHVRTVHSVKGDQYCTVIVVVRGFASKEDAERDFVSKTKKEVEEELRRYYVAITRAETTLHVVISEQYPPVWWAKVIEACQNRGVAAPEPPFVLEGMSSQKQFSRQPCGTKQEGTDITIRELCRKYNAGDHLVSEQTLSRIATADETPSGAIAAGVLCSEQSYLCFEGRGRDAITSPNSKLASLHVSDLHSIVVLFFAQCNIAPRDRIVHKVEDGLRFLEQLPLPPSAHKQLIDRLGKEQLCAAAAQRVGPDLATQGFFFCFAALLSEVMKNPNNSEASDALADNLLVPQAESVGLPQTNYKRPRSRIATIWNPLTQLVCERKQNETNQRTDIDAKFFVGALNSASRVHIWNMLDRFVKNPWTSPEKTLFRNRATVLDSANLVSFRCELIDAGHTFLQESKSGSISQLVTMTRCALLAHMCKGGGHLKERCHRSLPYFFSSTDESLKLKTEDIGLSSAEAEHITTSMAALRNHLLQFHDVKDLENLSINYDVSREVHVGRIQKKLVGKVHLKIPAATNKGTVVQLVCGTSSPTIHDEAHALLGGAMEGAQRALLYDVKSGELYTFDLSNSERILKTACEGLRRASDTECSSPRDEGEKMGKEEGGEKESGDVDMNADDATPRFSGEGEELGGATGSSSSSASSCASTTATASRSRSRTPPARTKCTQ